MLVGNEMVIEHIETLIEQIDVIQNRPEDIEMLIEQNILFEDDDDSDDLSDSDSDSDDDSEVNISLEIPEKILIRQIHNGIVMLQEMILFLENTYGSDYSEYVEQVFKLRKLFENFISYIDGYEQGEIKKILQKFKLILKNLTNKISE